MGRNKIERECTFQPKYKRFVPTYNEQNGVMELNNDEMEAIYLMDYKGLYQENAAKNMNISRPTLSRIIKNARKKMATAIVLGYEINIVGNKDKFIVALSTNTKGTFSNLLNEGIYIALIHLQNRKIVEINYVKNRYDELAFFLKKQQVHYWISSKVSEELRASLLAKGIFIKEIQSIEPIEDITKLFC